MDAFDATTLVARYGRLHVRDGKSRFAPRNGPLLARVKALLEARMAEISSQGIFSREVTPPMLHSSLDHLQKKLKQLLKMWG